ncbi:MAG: hypothetical protein H7061_13155 [Bdellovibrionaceae bacterium]|nr:hypothetical protein [Bdellovibrio sp.]
MKSLFAFVTLLTLSLTSFAIISDKPQARGTARIEAKLTTAFVDEIQASIDFSSTKDGLWQIEVWNQCPKFPCKPADFKDEKIIAPEIIEDTRAGDGILTMKLTAEMTIIHNPGGLLPPNAPRPEEYTLKYLLNGKLLVLPLMMESFIVTK